MATTSEARALPFFTDLVGSPLESGFIYIGQPGLDPVAYPISVTSDAAGAIVLAQPIRTMHGHAVSAGALVHMFCQVPYSITILDGAGRLVYASLKEIDPIATAIGTSSVQNAGSIEELRERDKNSTDLVWVNGYGMYAYDSSDTTSPESIPFTVVGRDGARYKLNFQYVNAEWVKVSAGPAPTSSQGAWLSWNDDGTGTSFLTNNCGLGSGGIVLRNVNASNTVETGRVTVNSVGGLTTSSGIVSATGIVASTGGVVAAADIKSTSGNVIAGGGTVAVTVDGSRALSWTGSSYSLPSAPLNINGSVAMTQAGLLANQLANGVGAVALGNNTAPSPPQAGTWSSLTAFNTVFLWVRTA
jgi:hypothetical protein